MSAESDYISAESANILRTTTLIRNLLEEERLRELAEPVVKLCQDFLQDIA
jgi:hypothetical protein